VVPVGTFSAHRGLESEQSEELPESDNKNDDTSNMAINFFTFSMVL